MALEGRELIVGRLAVALSIGEIDHDRLERAPLSAVDGDDASGAGSRVEHARLLAVLEEDLAALHGLTPLRRACVASCQGSRRPSRRRAYRETCLVRPEWVSPRWGGRGPSRSYAVPWLLLVIAGSKRGWPSFIAAALDGSSAWIAPLDAIHPADLPSGHPSSGGVVEVSDLERILPSGSRQRVGSHRGSFNRIAVCGMGSSALWDCPQRFAFGVGRGRAPGAHGRGRAQRAGSLRHGCRRGVPAGARIRATGSPSRVTPKCVLGTTDSLCPRDRRIAQNFVSISSPPTLR